MTAKSRIKLSIKVKLILVGALILISVVALEIFVSYVDSKVSKSIDMSTLRQEQQTLLSDLEVSLVEFTLAGMDAIIDHNSGVVAAELKEEMAVASSIWRKNLPRIGELADTEQEKKNAQTIAEVYPKLENALMLELPKLVTDRAGQELFDEIDDRIDGLSGQVDKPLKEMLHSVAEEVREATGIDHP